MKYTKSNLCQLPELGLSCIGCCGSHLKEKERALEDIKKNTLELAKYARLKDYVNRAKPDELRESGLCRNVTFIGYDKKSGNVLVGCPAHPEMENPEIDDRDSHCNIGHLCKLTQVFEYWDDEKRKSFFEFLQKRVHDGMDWYEYSIKMDNDELLKEFEESEDKSHRRRSDKV